MKQKVNARQRREAEILRRKGVSQLQIPAKTAEKIREKTREKTPAAKPDKVPEKSKQKPARRAETEPVKTPEEEAREFLEYLDRYDAPVSKDETPRPAKKKGGQTGSIPKLNLEDGMPVVSEALTRLNLGIQEMRHSQVKVVKLIHGYGSTGRGGKICAGVRNELEQMKRKKQIRDYIPGEDFGPIDAASRKLVEQHPRAAGDPDYGRMNHGITIVVL